MVASPSNPLDPVIGETRLVIYGIGWDGFQDLLQIIGNRLPRLAYSHGDVELMKPMFFHERCRGLLNRVVWTIAEELDLPMNSIGSTTLFRQDQDCGLEPGESYYIANAGRMRGQDYPDLDEGPPPDLAIEVEITPWELDRLAIYSRLGIPEVWRFDGEVLSIYQLQEGRHVESTTSLAFPFLPIQEVAQLLKTFDFVDDTRWSGNFRSWVRDTLLPLYRNADRPE